MVQIERGLGFKELIFIVQKVTLVFLAAEQIQLLLFPRKSLDNNNVTFDFSLRWCKTA